jgi:hypothetical protein
LRLKWGIDLIAVLISGGIGNQLFQYSAARRISKQTRKLVVLDVSVLANTLSGNKRNLEIENLANSLDLHCKALNGKQIEIDFRCFLDESKFHGHIKIITAIFRIYKKHKVIIHPKYSKTLSWLFLSLPSRHLVIPNNFNLDWIDPSLGFEVDNTFRTLNKAIIPYLTSLDYVSVHVRRGDYAMFDSIHFLQPLNYYESAMNYFQSKFPNSKFVVFSDDIAWCKSKLSASHFAIDFVDDHFGLSTCEEFWFLSKFSKAVISNSTFSLLAAYLDNAGKEVVFPEKWFFDNREDHFQFPPHWVKTVVPLINE